MPVAHIDDIDIAYDDSGGDGPALLFSHGFLMDRSMFDAQVAAFADRYRCIRWDERAFGGTRATRPFSYWDSASDAIGLLDHLGIDQAVMIGMSQGGFLSLRAALAHPDRVRALVLIGSAADLDDAATVEGYQGMLQILDGGSDEERAAVFGVVSGLILGDEALAADWVPKWEQLDRAQVMLAGAALLGRDDIDARLTEIGCPILAVHGTDDQAIAIDRAEALVAEVPDHRGVIRVDGAAHAPNMTHPDVVNRALDEFLSSL